MKNTQKGNPTSKQQPANRKMYSLREICTERQRFNVDPAFQREDVWPVRMQQALIDSILSGKSIASLSGYTEDNEVTGQRWIVFADGHQRITAILDYYDGAFRTWTPGEKRRSEPNSDLPVEPSRYFEQLSPIAKNNFLDYQIEVTLETFKSDAEITTHFLRLNNHVKLSAAEVLNAFKSRAKDAAMLIAEHPFWEDFYIGEMNRKQIYQNSLQLLAIELSSPGGILDLQSGIYFLGLASGNRDNDISDILVKRALSRLTIATSVFHGIRYSKRATIIPMYQSVMFLEQAGYNFKPEDKGRLTKWMKALIEESNRPSGIPVYVQPLQKLTRESAQKAFWARHLSTIMNLFGVNQPEMVTA